MQLPELQQLVAQQVSRLTPSSLAAVVLRAAKLRPPPSPQQQDALLVPTWEALRSQLAACKVRSLAVVQQKRAALETHPTAARPLAATRQCATRALMSDQVTSQPHMQHPSTQAARLVDMRTQPLCCCIQAYEVVLLLWAASKLGYADAGEQLGPQANLATPSAAAAAHLGGAREAATAGAPHRGSAPALRAHLTNCFVLFVVWAHLPGSS